MKPYRILWISESGLGKSESFIRDTLHYLQELASLRCISGNNAGNTNNPFDIHFEGFNFPELRLWERLVFKCFGAPIAKVILQKQLTHGKSQRLERALQHHCKEFRPHLIWFCYGTTAH